MRPFPHPPGSNPGRLLLKIFVALAAEIGLVTRFIHLRCRPSLHACRAFKMTSTGKAGGSGSVRQEDRIPRLMAMRPRRQVSSRIGWVKFLTQKKQEPERFISREGFICRTGFGLTAGPCWSIQGNRRAFWLMRSAIASFEQRFSLNHQLHHPVGVFPAAGENEKRRLSVSLRWPMVTLEDTVPCNQYHEYPLSSYPASAHPQCRVAGRGKGGKCVD